MRRLILALFVAVIATGGFVGVTAADSPPVIAPPNTCTGDLNVARQMAADIGMTLPANQQVPGSAWCFYPARPR
jgi:hypothetical protein